MMNLDDVYAIVKFPKDETKFWDLNFELKYVKPFYEFSKKPESAKIMCAIWLVYDPKSAIYNSGTVEEKAKEEVAETFLKNKKFPWKDYREYIEAYKNFSRTKIEKQLDDYLLIIKERQQAGADLDWTDDFDTKDKIIKTQDEFYDKYFNLVSRLNDEREDALAHGKYTPSLLESRGQNLYQ